MYRRNDITVKVWEKRKSPKDRRRTKDPSRRTNKDKPNGGWRALRTMTPMTRLKTLNPKQPVSHSIDC